MATFYRVYAIHKSKYRYVMADYDTQVLATAAIADPTVTSVWDTNMISMIGSLPDGGYISEQKTV